MSTHIPGIRIVAFLVFSRQCQKFRYVWCYFQICLPVNNEPGPPSMSPHVFLECECPMQQMLSYFSGESRGFISRLPKDQAVFFQAVFFQAFFFQALFLPCNWTWTEQQLRRLPSVGLKCLAFLLINDDNECEQQKDCCYFTLTPIMLVIGKDSWMIWSGIPAMDWQRASNNKGGERAGKIPRTWSSDQTHMHFHVYAYGKT